MDVRIDNLRFKRDGKIVLSIDELHFPAGKTTAVLGPNGSGKTTLLRVVAGLERPNEGRVVVGTEPVQGPCRAVAFALQSPVFLTGSARENIELALRLKHVQKSERRARSEEAARALGVEPLLDKNAKLLSRGEAQRVSLARTLAIRAPVTLLDEPLSGIDAPARYRLMNELPRAFGDRGATVILVTHDRDEARSMAEHVVILLEGRARAAGRAEEVFKNPPDPASAALLGYVVVPLPDGGFAAAPAGSLRVGEGDLPIAMVVQRTLETAQGIEVIGALEGEGTTTRASLPSGEPPPPPGSRAAIKAPRWVRFPPR